MACEMNWCHTYVNIYRCASTLRRDSVRSSQLYGGDPDDSRGPIDRLIQAGEGRWLSGDQNARACGRDTAFDKHLTVRNSNYTAS